MDFRKILNVTVALVFGFQVTSCNFMKTKHIDSSYKKLVRFLEDEQSLSDDPLLKESKANRLAQIAAFDQRVQNVKTLINKPPRLDGTFTADIETAKLFIAANQDRIQGWLQSVDNHAKMFQNLTREISKNAYLNVSPEEALRDQMVLYFFLNYQRAMYSKLIDASSPIAMGAAHKAFDKVPEILEFRKFILDRFFSYMGMIIVIDNDLEKTATLITQFSETHTMHASLKKILAKAQKKILKKNQKRNSGLRASISSLSEEERKGVEEKIAAFHAKFENESLLYNPNKRDSWPINVLVWLGNLTWGAVNTILGLGAVLITMIVSPFTRYVDFPSFRLSANRNQIYVDVAGVIPMYGKASLGLFELDNAAGWSFNAGHSNGHAKQSAVLGPFYLFAVAASYLISGFGSGFIENWADVWANWE